MSLRGVGRCSRAVPGVVSAELVVTPFRLRGEPDLSTPLVTVEGLIRVLAESAVAVDLARTDFVENASGRAFHRAGQRLGGPGRQLTPRSPSGLADGVLSLCGLSHLVEPG